MKNIQLFMVLLTITLSNCSPTTRPSIAPDYYLQPMNATEIEKTKLQVREFYAKELFQAGCCSTIEEARVAAQQEIQNESNNYFLNITCTNSKLPIGYLWYDIEPQLDGSAKAFIQAIFLEKEYRGQGIAEVAHKNLETQLSKEGTTTMQLYVFAHNVPAFKLYKKLGYTTIEEYKNNEKIIGYLLMKNLQSLKGD